jgi:hypothetical protein
MIMSTAVVCWVGAVGRCGGEASSGSRAAVPGMKDHGGGVGVMSVMVGVGCEAAGGSRAAVPRDG